MIRLDAAALDGAISIASTQHGQCATAVLVVRFKTLPPSTVRAHTASFVPYYRCC